MTDNKRSSLKASIALNIFLIVLIMTGIWYAFAFAEKLQEQHQARHANYIAEKKAAFAASPLEQVDVVFVGDSITDNGAWDEYFPGYIVANRGVRSDQTLHVFDRIDGVIALRPTKIFLMVGVNDLGMGRTPQELVATYARILDRLESELPEAQVYIQSILPVAEGYHVPGINPGADEANAMLADLAEQRGHTFLNVRELFAREGGSLSMEFSHDGIHLSGDAYTRWRDFLRPYILQ